MSLLNIYVSFCGVSSYQVCSHLHTWPCIRNEYPGYTYVYRCGGDPGSISVCLYYKVVLCRDLSYG